MQMILQYFSMDLRKVWKVLLIYYSNLQNTLDLNLILTKHRVPVNWETEKNEKKRKETERKKKRKENKEKSNEKKRKKNETQKNENKIVRKETKQKEKKRKEKNVKKWNEMKSTEARR